MQINCIELNGDKSLKCFFKLSADSINLSDYYKEAVKDISGLAILSSQVYGIDDSLILLPVPRMPLDQEIIIDLKQKQVSINIECLTIAATLQALHKLVVETQSEEHLSLYESLKSLSRGHKHAQELFLLDD